MAPAAIVMAKAPRPGFVKTRLEPLLGPEGCAALQAGLIRRAAAWAAAVAPGAAHVAFAPADAEGELRALVGAEVGLVAQVEGDLGDRLAAVTEAVLAAHDGPVIVVGTDMPTLGPEHAGEALAALRDGADVCFGPAHDGGYYLVGLTRSRPEVFALPSDTWGGPEVLEHSRRLAAGAGLAVALTGPEGDSTSPPTSRRRSRTAACPRTSPCCCAKNVFQNEWRVRMGATARQPRQRDRRAGGLGDHEERRAAHGPNLKGLTPLDFATR